MAAFKLTCRSRTTASNRLKHSHHAHAHVPSCNLGHGKCNETRTTWDQLHLVRDRHWPACCSRPPTCSKAQHDHVTTTLSIQLVSAELYTSCTCVSSLAQALGDVLEGHQVQIRQHDSTQWDMSRRRAYVPTVRRDRRTFVRANIVSAFEQGRFRNLHHSYRWKINLSTREFTSPAEGETEPRNIVCGQIRE